MTDKTTELQNATDDNKFDPTPGMIVWLDTVIQSQSDVVDKISELSGIEESTYYRWLKQPGFLDWFEAERQKKMKAHAWRLDNIGLQNAKRDHKYWQDMQKRVGNLQDTKGSTVALQVNNYSKAAKNADEFIMEVESDEA